MKFRIKTSSARKIISYLATLSMFVNIFSPFLVVAPEIAYAAEETTVSEETTAEEESPFEELIENSTEEEESVDMSAISDDTEEVVEDLIVTPAGEEQPVVTDTVEVEETTPEQSLGSEETVSAEELEGEILPEAAATVREGEEGYEELNGDVVDSTSDDWEVDGAVAETRNDVEIGIRYVFPLDEDVTVTFTTLPKDLNLRSSLRIERIKVSDLDLPDEFETDAEYAFDITTEMKNGEFEYDFTLPKPEGVEAKVISIDKSVEELTSDEITVDEVEVIDESLTDQDGDKVKIKDQSHFSAKIPVYIEPESIEVITATGPSVGGCIVEETPMDNVNCTANDVSLAGPFVEIAPGDGCDYPGDTVVVDLSVDVEVTASSDRFDIGIWMSSDGDPNGDGSESGECIAAILPTSSPGFDLDGDTCGDAEETDADPDISRAFIGQVELICNDDDLDGQLDVPVLTSWRQPGANDTCSVPYDAYPGAPSKCRMDMTFNIPVPVPGQIIVQKETIPDASSQEFAFTLTGDSVSESFNLMDGEQWDSGLEISGGLMAGTYALSETPLSDWDLTDVTCVSSLDDTESADSLDLQPGETITCTFTNTMRTATLTLVKDLVTDNGGTATEDDFQARINGDPVPWGEPQTLMADTYTASETTVLTGYEASDWYDDCETDGSITLEPGLDYTCTITNNDIQPLLTVTKVVEGSTEPVSSFTLYVEGTEVVSGDQNGFDAGTYTVSEDEVSEYNAVISGDCNSETGDVTLEVGDVKSCTITNTRKQGDVTFIKNVNVGQEEPSSWTFDVYKDGELVGTYNHDETVTLDTGEYTVLENGPGTYFLDSISGTACSPSTVPGTADLVVNENGGTCIFGNSETSTITIIKDSVPNDAQDFEFTVTGDGLSGFTLDDDSDATLENSETFDGLLPGDYSVTELSVNGWDLTSLSCDTSIVGKGIPPFAGNTASITLEAGEIVTCTFTNTSRGKIIVEKQTSPDGSDQEFEFDPSWDGDFWLMDGETNESSWLEPGSYSVTEIVPEGWDLGSIVCDDPTQNSGESAAAGNTASIDLGAGETVTCTFNNNQRPGITIDKVTYPSGSSEEFTINLNQGLMGQHTTVHQSVLADQDNPDSYIVPAGEYWLEELENQDWVLTDIECVVNGDEFNSFDPRADGFVLGYGDSLVCTFTNTQNGSISGVKFEDNDERTLLSGWTIFIDENSNGVLDSGEESDVTDGNGEYSFEGLEPGQDYEVCEVLQVGWYQTLPGSMGSPECYTVSLEPGQQASDYDFGNYRYGAVSGYKFEDIDGDGIDDGESRLSGWTINITGPGGYSNSAVTAGDGSYSFSDLPYDGEYIISEVLKSGWSQTYPASAHIVNVESGYSETDLNFGNFEHSTVIVCKEDTEEDRIPGWGVYVDTTLQYTEANGCTTFIVTQAGDYDITEEPGNGWTPYGPTSYEVTVESGETYGPYTFVNFENTEVEVCKEDTEGDPIMGWGVSINDMSQRTGEDGCANFPITEPGRYHVAEESREGWTPHGETFYDFTAESDGSYGPYTFVNFENVDLTVCKEDTEENRIPGWGVYLDFDQKVTGRDGCYTWEVTAPGTYRASEESRTGWTPQGGVFHDFVVTSGLEPQSHTFVNFENIDVEACKYIDVDGDGSISGDPAYTGGWSVYLDGVYGNTSDNGCYVWNDVGPGSHTVTEGHRAGWIQTYPEGDSYTFDAVSGQDMTTPEFGSFDFGNFELGKITACKYEDINGNGSKDPEDFPLSSIRMLLLDSEMSQIASGATSGEGCVEFSGLQAGDYRVVEDYTDPDLKGYYPSNGVTHRDVSVVSGFDETVDFVNSRYRTISGQKFEDYDGDGIKDAGEPGLEGWTIFIDDGDGVFEAGEVSAITDANGDYEIKDLVSDSYKVCEVQQPDWIQTAPEMGCHEVDLHESYSATDIDFGNRLPLTIVVHKIVCDSESDLPNWGNGPSNNITEITAQRWVNAHPGCHFEEGWQFQWGDDADFNPGDDTIGEVAGWNTFGPTDENGMASIEISDLGDNQQIKVREVLKEGYLPFTYTTSGNQNTNPVSAELYCDVDVLNYDNDDRISNPLYGHTYNCVAWNVELSDIHGYKWNDLNGNGERDCVDQGVLSEFTLQAMFSEISECEMEPLLSGWTINLYRWNGEGYSYVDSMDTDDDAHFGWYWFEDLLPGQYRICEEEQTSWGQTYPGVPQEPECHIVQIPSECGMLGQDAFVTRATIPNFVVTQCEYHFGNQYNEPQLLISKENDTGGADMYPGDDVLFTITVRALQSMVLDVTVRDLLPDGFKFRSGSAKVDGLTVGDPSYASPGEWYLGDMDPDDVHVLTYIADIQGDVGAGLYKDLAWAWGKDIWDEDVTADSENPGVVNDTFVGTEVNVIVDPETDKTDVDVDETEEGEVLGISTMPETGLDTIWLGVVFGLGVIGSLLLLLGGMGNMKRENKNGTKSVSALLVLLTAILLGRNVYAATNLVLRISEPESPATDDFDIVFVAMDIEDRDLKATCSAVRPDSSTTSFDTVSIPSGDGGDSNVCEVDSSVLTKKGTYDFTVKLETTSGSAETTQESVSVFYDGEGPETPEYIEKDKKSDCKNKISFKTGELGETTYVEIYRDDDKEIDIDDSHRIKTISIGPDDKDSFEDEFYGSDCGKTYYYAIRAFDDAGNPSDPRAEEVVTTKTTTTTDEGEEVLEAIYVGDAGLVGDGVSAEREDGAVEGEEAKDDEEGSVLGEETIAEEVAKMGKSLFTRWWLWVILAIGAGIVGNVLTKKKKN